MASVTISISSPTWLLRGLAMLMAPAMVVIMGIDLRIRGQERLLIHGIADEIAHVLTAVVMLSVFYAIGFRVNWIAAMIGGMLLDADYVLQMEDVVESVAGTGRGAIHTIGPTLAVLVVGALIPPLRTLLLSLGIGMLSHLIRDSATAATPLMWPVSDYLFHLRYSLYLTFMVACTLVTTGVVALGARPWRR
jgi:hypothetical protein